MDDGAPIEVAAGAQTQTAAVRAFLDGHAGALEAADAAGLPIAAFLDLVDRVREAEAGGWQPGGPIPDVSVVIPVYNEEANLDALLDVLIPTLASIGTFEIVFVDDCSTDRSRPVILRRQAETPAITLVELARNFGHQAALSAGIDRARGHAVVLMDADLQDPPELLPALVAKWREGFEVVFAVRRKRKEGRIKRASYYLFYRLLRRLAEVDLPVDSGDFCLMDRKVVDALKSLPETNRFLRGLRGWVGFRQVGVEYDRPARLRGEPKYTTRKLVRLAVDGLLAFSSVPLRLASVLGFLTTIAAVLYLLVAIAAKVFGGTVPAGWTSIIFVQLILGGVQLLMIGVVGEYLASTYQEAKRRPTYVVRAVHAGAGRGRPSDG